MNKCKLLAAVVLVLMMFPHVLYSDTNDGNYWYRKGLQEKDLNNKIEFFNRALQLDPRNVEAYNSLGIVYIKKGLYDLAISNLRTAIKVDPNHVNAHINLAIATRSKGNPAEAVRIYDKVLRLDPHSLTALYNQAIAFENLKEYDKAVNNYLKALSMDDGNPKVMLNLGVAYYRAGNMDRGVQVLQTLLESHPDYAKAHFNLGMIYREMNRTSDARYHFGKARDLGLSVPDQYMEGAAGTEPAKPYYTRWAPPTSVPTVTPPKIKQEEMVTTEYVVETPPPQQPDREPVKETIQVPQITPTPEPQVQHDAMETTIEPEDEMIMEIEEESEVLQPTAVPEQEVDEPQHSMSHLNNVEHSYEEWFQMGLDEKDGEKREYYFKRCLKIKPNYVSALLELGNLYLARAQEQEKYGNKEKSEDMARKAVDQYVKITRLDPDLANVFLNLGVIYRYYLYNPRKTVQYWEKYLKLVPASDRSRQIEEELEYLRSKIE